MNSYGMNSYGKTALFTTTALRALERTRQVATCFGISSLLTVTFPQFALANPTGANVVAGSAAVTTRSPSTLTVDQKTKIVIIDWQSFNIAAGETTKFNQPGTNAMAVNRIGSADPAQILGNLIANGRVVLIDGNGILFGPNAKVNVGALLATASDASNADILSGKATFDKAGDPNARIVNDGSIAATSGMVGLIAPAVTNNGIVRARLNQVTLGASNVFTVDFTGDGLISFPVDANVIAAAIDENGRPVQALVANNGRIEGSTVLLSARAAAGLVTSVISTNGEIIARSFSDTGGKIVLDGGQGGIALNGALLDASGKNGGGSITVGGWQTPLVTADAKTVLDASAAQTGNGGSISVISQNTSFYGTAKAKGGSSSGNGGSVETSGHSLDVTGARVDMTAAHGGTGSWVLDPYNVTISNASTSNASSFAATGDNSIISVADLQNALATSNVVVTTGTSGTQAGDIEVASSINWNSASSLTLKAWRNIAIDDGVTISNTGTGGLTLYADTGANSVGGVSFGTGASAHLASGNMSVYYHSSDFVHPVNYSGYLVGSGSTTGYMLIDTIGDLQAISGNGYDGTDGQTYALNADLDLSAVNTFHYSSGWSPLGNYNGDFYGVFDGQNHTISGLTITSPGTNGSIGLFYRNEGLIENLNLTGASISVGCCLYSDVGTVAGINEGTISNVHASGSVYGAWMVGGLVGIQYNGSISDSSSSVNVTGARYSDTGGLAGANSASITRSWSSGSVYAEDIGGSTGGFVGFNNGTITQSFSTGSVSMLQTANSENSTYVGGFVGNSNGGTISQSYETGSVSATFNDETPENTMAIGVGAFAGTQMPLGGGPSPGSISQSYATGSLFAQNVWTPSCDGCGWGPTRIYTGFVGNTKYGSNVSSSYYDGATTGLGGGTTTSQLQAALPTGFDPTVWGIVPNMSYPYLTWQFPNAPQVVAGNVYSDAGTTP
jgi:filamentous hemagglutinin family protein